MRDAPTPAAIARNELTELQTSHSLSWEHQHVFASSVPVVPLLRHSDSECAVAGRSARLRDPCWLVVRALGARIVALL